MKAIVKINGILNKSFDYYQVKMDKGMIKIIDSGGNGGEGGAGGKSGNNGGVATYGGWGGVGGNGGRGGQVTVHIDSLNKKALNNLKIINKGGNGGQGGLSGDHPKGLKSVEMNVNIAGMDFTKYKESNSDNKVYSGSGNKGNDGDVMYKFENVDDKF